MAIILGYISIIKFSLLYMTLDFGNYYHFLDLEVLFRFSSILCNFLFPESNIVPNKTNF